MHNKYDHRTKPTIAWEYAMKLFQFSDVTLRLNLWDIGKINYYSHPFYKYAFIAGQDNVGGLNKLFWRQAAGAAVVWDLTDQETIENAVRWKEQLDDIWAPTNDVSSFPIVLFANKYDLISEYEDENQKTDDYMHQE